MTISGIVRYQVTEELKNRLNAYYELTHPNALRPLITEPYLRFKIEVDDETAELLRPVSVAKSGLIIPIGMYSYQPGVAEPGKWEAPGYTFEPMIVGEEPHAGRALTDALITASTKQTVRDACEAAQRDFMAKREAYNAITYAVENTDYLEDHADASFEPDREDHDAPPSVGDQIRANPTFENAFALITAESWVGKVVKFRDLKSLEAYVDDYDLNMSQFAPRRMDSRHLHNTWQVILSANGDGYFLDAVVGDISFFVDGDQLAHWFMEVEETATPSDVVSPFSGEYLRYDEWYKPVSPQSLPLPMPPLRYRFVNPLDQYEFADGGGRAYTFDKDTEWKFVRLEGMADGDTVFKALSHLLDEGLCDEYDVLTAAQLTDIGINPVHLLPYVVGTLDGGLFRVTGEGASYMKRIEQARKIIEEPANDVYTLLRADLARAIAVDVVKSYSDEWTVIEMHDDDETTILWTFMQALTVRCEGDASLVLPSLGVVTPVDSLVEQVEHHTILELLTLSGFDHYEPDIWSYR